MSTTLQDVRKGKICNFVSSNHIIDLDRLIEDNWVCLKMVVLPQSYVDKENMINDQCLPLNFQVRRPDFSNCWLIISVISSYFLLRLHFWIYVMVKTPFSSWICGGRVRLVLPTESFFITWPGDGCAFHPLPLDHEQEDRFSHMSQSELGTYRAAAPQNVDPGWVTYPLVN